MSALTLHDLSKRFGGTTALSAIDLTVPQGSRTAVVGPSGSGKTTLLRLIAGFEAPDSGEVLMDGHVVADTWAAVPPHRRNIGLVMQEGALFPHLTVLENIGFGLERGEATTQALQLMDLVELDRAMASRAPHQLSGGQQQRVALARALARRPRLMLLDEPFSALDPALRDQLRQATARILAEAGVTTVLVTHDRDEAMSFADQLVVLRAGKLVQAGPPRRLYLAPADRETAAFLGPAIFLDARIDGAVAHTALGPLPLDGPQPFAPGPATILIRPEQMVLTACDGSGDGRLRSIERAGMLARVVLDLGAPGVLSFDTLDRDLPPAGAAVAIRVVGTVHRVA